MAHGDPGVELLEPLEESGTPIFRVAKAAANRIEELQPLGAHMQRTLRFASMPELLATTRADAIIAADNRPALSHQQLKEFVENFDLARFGITVNDRVGVLLPDGPELGVCILAVMVRGRRASPSSTSSLCSFAYSGARYALLLSNDDLVCADDVVV